MNQGLFRVLKTIIILLLFPYLIHAKAERLSEYSIVEKDNKKGLVNEKGDIVIPVIYDDLGWSKGSFSVVNNTLGFKQGHLWGLIDLNGNVVVKPKYHLVYPVNDILLVAASQDPFLRELKFGAINHKGKIEVRFKYSNLEPFAKVFIATENKDGKKNAGVLNFKDKLLLPFNYKNISGVGLKNLSVTNENNKAALFDVDGKQLTPFNFDSISYFRENTLVVYQSGMKGLVSSSGKTVLDIKYKRIEPNSTKGINVLHYPEWTILNSSNQVLKKVHFDEIVPLGKDFYKVKAEGQQAIINSFAEFVIPLKDWEVMDVKDSLIVIRMNEKIGVVHVNGKSIVSPVYDNLYLHHNYIIASKLKFSEMRYSLFYKNGAIISEGHYENILSGSEGFFPVKHQQKWGFINTLGKEVVICKFDSVSNFHEGRSKVFYLDNFGVIDPSGQWLIKPFYETLDESAENIFLHRRGRLHTFINLSEEKIFRTANYIYPHTLGYIEKEENGCSWLIRPNGSKIIEDSFDSISLVHDDSLVYLFKSGKTAIFNKKGKVLMKFDGRFEKILPPSEGYIGCKIDGSYGFVDLNGKLRIANQYEAIGKYAEGLSKVKIMGKWGFIDKQERWIVQPYYDSTSDFNNGIAVVEKKGRFGLINRKGEQVLGLEYDDIEALGSGNYKVRSEGFTGMANGKGKLILSAKFDEITDLKNNFMLVERDGKKGLISDIGVSTIPMVYDELIHDHINEVYIIGKNAIWETLNINQP